jgi:hypothetical protein
MLVGVFLMSFIRPSRLQRTGKQPPIIQQQVKDMAGKASGGKKY